MASTAREESLYICLVEDKQHLQARHLMPFSPANKRTFGLTVYELIQPWAGSDKGQGTAQRVKISHKHVEFNHSSCYRNARQENTKPHTFFVSQHGFFHSYRRMKGLKNGHSGGHAGSPRWRLQYPKDVDLHQGLKLCKKLMAINAHC